MRRYCAAGRVLDPDTGKPVTKLSTPFGDAWMVPLDPATGLPVVLEPERKRAPATFPQVSRPPDK